MNRRRVLVLCPFSPQLQAVHGGAFVIAQTLRHLAEVHSIAVLYLKGTHEPHIDPELARACAFTEAFDRRDSTGVLSDIICLARSVAQGVPTWVQRTYSRALHARLRQVVREWHPDVVQAEYHVMGQYLPAVREFDCMRVLVDADPGSRATENRLETATGLKKAALYTNLFAWRKFERAVVDDADAVIVFTESDREHILSFRPGAAVHCVPFAAELPSVYSSEGSGEKKILFVGHYHHYPNSDAAQRLIERIFPEVLRREPQARLQLVGADPTTEMQRAAAAAGSRVDVPGYVSDLPSYIRTADVCAAPIFLGGGMRVKVVETFAHGKAIVATDLAVAGIPVSNGEHYLRAETDGEFADAIVRLLQNPEERMALGTRARQHIGAALSWDRVVAEHDAVYR